MTIKDPIEQTLEEAALERARAHVAELDAEARLGDEAAADPAADPAASPTPAPPAQTREEADAEALAEFQRLRDRASKKTL